MEQREDRGSEKAGRGTGDRIEGKAEAEGGHHVAEAIVEERNSHILEGANDAGPRAGYEGVTALDVSGLPALEPPGTPALPSVALDPRGPHTDNPLSAEIRAMSARDAIDPQKLRAASERTRVDHEPGAFAEARPIRKYDESM